MMKVFGLGIISCFFLLSCAVAETPEIPEEFLPENNIRNRTTCYPACPQDETCVADNFCMFIESDPEGKVCEFHGVCEEDEYCVEGRCTKIECLFSRHRDENETLPCYSGPAESLNYPPCARGERECLETGFFGPCIGEVVPVLEEGFLACNGIDDDCDGIPDAGQIASVDIVFLFDISGSMIEEFHATLFAIREIASFYDTPSVRMALVTFPNASQSEEWYPELVVPLLPYEEFLRELVFSLVGLNTTGGKEASWDIPWMLANNLLEGISWRPDARKVIVMFTDEKGQSYLDINNDGCSVQGDSEVCDNTEETMCEALIREEILLYTFTNMVANRFPSRNPLPEGTSRVYEDFDDCGEVYSLTTDGLEMAENLQELANTVCSF